MKKILISLIIILFMSFTSCELVNNTNNENNNDKEYEIIYKDNFTEEHIKEINTLKAKAGDEIVIKTNIIYDLSMNLFVNGKYKCGFTPIQNDEGNYTHWEFYFTMPDKDAIVELKDEGSKIFDPYLSFTDNYMQNPLYTTDAYFDYPNPTTSDYHSIIVPLSEVEFNTSLQIAFQTNLSDEYLINNFNAYYFERVEGMYSEYLDDVEYQELFIENNKLYVTRHYRKTTVVGNMVITTYPEIILIPKQWHNIELNETKNINIPLVVNIHDMSTSETNYIMSYNKMNELKEAHIRIKDYPEEYGQVKVYIYNAYGEYNNSLVVFMTDNQVGYYQAITKEIVAGYSFNYSDSNQIRVYYDGEFYSLFNAYKSGILTKDNITSIYNLYQLNGTYYFK